MDQIWDRNPSKSEVIGRCGGDEKPNHAEPTKSHAKNPNKTSRIDCSLMLQKVKMSQSNIVAIHKIVTTCILKCIQATCIHLM